MNYITVLIFFTSFFLEIFNSHAILIECNVVDISSFDEKKNHVETKHFCNLDIPIDDNNDGKINLNDLKNNIKNNYFLKNNYFPDIINNIENYIITDAYYYKYTQTILNFKEGNIIIPKEILDNLKKYQQSPRNCIVINFISEESFKKLKSIKITEIVSLVEGVERLCRTGYGIELKDLQEGFYKKDWNYSIFNYVFHNFQKTIEEWEEDLKMKFLNDGSDFKILQDGKEINILQCLQNNKCDNLTIKLQFAYQFKFDVEYKPKNKDFEIRDDFEEENFKKENGNIYKTLKDSHEDFGERCTYYKKLCITFKNKSEFIDKLKKNFYSEDRHTNLKFIINNNDINFIDPISLLGKKNKLTVICSEFSEYVKSYVINLGFAVNNIEAGVWVSEYSICKELYSMNSKKLAFTKKEDITAENIKKKLNIIDNEAISNEIIIAKYNKPNEKFDQNKFFDGIQICLNINKEYALKNNIIQKKETNKESSNNYYAKVQIFKDDKLPNPPEDNKNDSDKTITKLNSNNGFSNLTSPNCCCVNCCSKCCK